MLALALVFVALSLGVLIALAEVAEHRSLRRELRLEIASTARLSGRVLAAPMWYVNVGNVTAGLEVLLDHDAVVAAVARDAEGTVLAWCTAGAESPNGDRLCGKAGWPSVFDLTAWPRQVEKVHYQQELGPRQEAGELEVFYSERRIAELMRRRVGLGALLFLVALASLTAGIFLATRRAVLTPLERWRQAIRDHRGEGLRKVDWTSADEFGELVREYNERVDEERESRAEIGRRTRMFEDAFESLRRGFCIFDRDFRLVAFNRRYLEILDHSEGSVETGMSLKTLLRANAAKGEYGSASIDAVVIDRLAIAASGEHYRRERDRPDGTVLEVESSPTPDGGFVSLYTDVTQQKALEGQMRHLTLNDPTTGLANRALFHDRLRQALAVADRLGLRLALHLIDVDDFTGLNQLHGRELCDAVLKELAERLRQLVRKSDTAARLEDDRFAVIQQHLPSFDEAALLAHRIVGSLSRAFEIGDQALRLTASIGITVYPDDDRRSRNIMKNAVLALAAAKAEGRHRSRFFVPEVDREVQRRRRFEEELFNGLKNEQFVLHYQPRIDLETGALAGVEALLRWRHPQRGLVHPSEFMALAEDRGLIVPLCEWMLVEACRQRLEWQGLAGGSWRVTVPLSARYFEEGDVVASVQEALEKTALEHRYLEIEVATGALAGGADSAVGEGLHSLRALGVASIVEDFGNGISPLAVLRRLPVDAVKIDRQLVRDCQRDAEAAAILKTVILLGRQLHLRVSAAGVEEVEQLQRLKDEGCHEAQGGVVSPPLASDELGEWLASRVERVATAGTGAD